MANKTVAVLQSNYLPWKGYFDIINDVDLFVFYDEVQYTKNDWRNRNRIYGSYGLEWLTVPCGYDIKRKIFEVRINSEIDWQAGHYSKICQAYANSPFFSLYKPFLEHVFLECKWDYLSDLNQFLVKQVAYNFLDIGTLFSDSREYVSTGSKAEKLLSLLISIGCDEYISGSAARNYIDEALFDKNGIRVIWKDYSGYPEYEQLHLPFEHNVSIVDLLMNTGDDAPYYIWGWREHHKEGK